MNIVNNILFSADANDAVRYPFIEEYCGDPNELNVYESLVVTENGVSQRGLFSIEAFSFNGDEDGDIYLHCQVSHQILYLFISYEFTRHLIIIYAMVS